MIFDPSLKGQTIRLDSSTPGNHIRIDRELDIEGPGADSLTISGDRKTRIFLVVAPAVRISGLTLTEGYAKGGDGGAGSGGAGGGGGGAGMGGAIFLMDGRLTLNRVTLTGNRAVGGTAGIGGKAHSPGDGGGGGGFGGPGEGGPSGKGGTAGDLAVLSFARSGVGGKGGRGQAGFADAGEEGGWGAGGGGGSASISSDSGAGGPGGKSDFAGGQGGTGGFFDSDGTTAVGRAGNGGSGIGGAIFVSAGLLEMQDCTFMGNSAVGGPPIEGSDPGPAKGGDLAVCSAAFCGTGHTAAAVVVGTTRFQGASAADAGSELNPCPGRDDDSVCGYLSEAVPTHFRIKAPPQMDAGETFLFTISALDVKENVVAAYNGTVQVSSSDPNSLLPPDAPIANGLGVFSVTLTDVGTHTVKVFDTANPSISGSATISVVKPTGPPAEYSPYRP